jgi:hypothetical protein
MASSVPSFLRALRREEDPLAALEAVARARGVGSTRGRAQAAAAGGSDPDSEYDAAQCRLDYFTHPERGGKRYTPLFQLAPVPSSLLPGGPTFYIKGGIGYGSCFYDSICDQLNVNGYADAALRHDQATLKQIVERFRCAFMKGLSTEQWRAFLKNEMAETPNSNTWRDVVQERITDTRQDLRDDFCSYDVWATEATARYIARELHLTIYVIDTSNWRAFCGVHGVNDDDPVVLIAWERSTHFSPIVYATGVRGETDNDAQVELVGVITDPELKRRLRRAYETTWCQCASSDSPCFRP